jgi:hypothetical protein
MSAFDVFRYDGKRVCNDAARAIAGVTLITDVNYFAAGMTGAFPGATPIVNFLHG